MAGCADASSDESAGRDAIPDARTEVEETRREEPGSASRPRVVFLGTSLTAGYGLEDPQSQSWVGRIGALADSAGLDVEVVNAGSSGDTSTGGLGRLDWILRRPLGLLVVELGANDGMRGQDTGVLADNLTTIVRETRQAYPDAQVALVAMEAPRNMGPEYVERFRLVFSTVARETGAALVPFPLEEVAGRPELNLPDGIHPTPAGHDVLARSAWPHLLPLLQQVVADRGASRQDPPGGDR